MAGRRPTPTAVKKLRGNPGKRKLASDEMQPESGRPKRPKFLTKPARRFWNKIIPELERLGVLTVIDGNALGMYCNCMAAVEDAQTTIAQYGRVISEPIIAKGEVVGHKLVKNPACNIEKEMMQQARAFGGLFGLSPSDRSRIKLEPPKKEDPLDELLRRKREAAAASPVQ